MENIGEPKAERLPAIGFKRVTGPEASDPDHIYHATSEDRALEIAQTGLHTHGPSDFTDQETWPDGRTEKRCYFTATAADTWQFAPPEGKPVLLRIKRPAGLRRERITGDLYVTKSVPATAFEYLGDDGKWHGLVTGSAPIALTPDGARLPYDLGQAKPKGGRDVP